MKGQFGRRVCAAAAVIAAVTAAAPLAHPLDAGWIPNSAGLPPLPAATPEGDVAFINPTRRIVAQPNIPGRFLLGHAIFGLYEGGGAGWTSLTPNCLSLVRSLFEDLAGMLGGCGVEGIAIDPADPLGMFVSTYNIDILAATIPVTYGGVYRTQLPFGLGRQGTAGVTWRKILGGVRGNAIAVKRPAATQPQTIVSGRIQRALHDVGTDANQWCEAVARADRCSPSVYVSSDGGTSWTPKYFDGSSCPNGQANVYTSSRIVGNLAFDPANNNVVYAGANSGLWVSTDSGASWTNELVACGSNPGFVATEGRSGSQRIYVGTFDGTLRVGPTGASGPGPLQTLELSRPIAGQILSIVLDPRDDDERTMFVASWTQPPPTGGGRGGIYHVIDRGDGTAAVTQLDDSVLGFLEPVADDLPLPYPVIQDPDWRPSLFLAQHPVAPSLLWVSTVLGGVWTRAVDAP